MNKKIMGEYFIKVNLKSEDISVDDIELTRVFELIGICKKFIIDNKISSPDVIYQNDQVSINSFEFIEEVCNIVGYFE